jgi:hypothetical protein
MFIRWISGAPIFPTNFSASKQMVADSSAARSARSAMGAAACMSLCILVAFLATTTGCNRKENKTAPPAAAVSPEQESFDRIVRYMEHMLVEPDPSRPSNVQQFSENSDGSSSDSTSVLTYEIKVDSSPEVIPPANPGEPYRGIITVTMDTSYTRIVMPQGTSKDDSHDESGEESGRSANLSLGENGSARQGVEGDRGDKGEAKSKTPKRSVRLDPVETKVEFELEYVDGKWQLASGEPDTKLSAAVDTLRAALRQQ